MLENRADIEFFAEHAGYCTPPGRMVCARQLADAERAAKAEGMYAEWVDDDEPYEMGDAEDHYPDYVMGCIIKDAKGNDVGPSLWQIGFHHDPRPSQRYADPYCRVVEAELFSESLAYIREKRSVSVGAGHEI